MKSTPALMFDLMLLAYQTDMTRVVSFMVGREESGATYPQIGISEPHHPLSHHQDVPEKIEKLAKINAYHMQLFTDFLLKLRATEDGDGSLLDHLMILYGSAIRNSNRHNTNDLPILVAGGGAGRDRRGTAHRLCRGHAADRPPVHDAREAGRSGGSLRRQRAGDPRALAPRVVWPAAGDKGP